MKFPIAYLQKNYKNFSRGGVHEFSEFITLGIRKSIDEFPADRSLEMILEF